MDAKKLYAKIPETPGVYKMKNADNKVMYVGKAKNLKKRVSSYFQKTDTHTERTKKMVAQIVDIETISVDSELEAIMLETNIIKLLRPKYNILMKDDKNFSYVKVHIKEDFPRISVVRTIEQDGSLYFGPKTSGKAAKETLKFLKKLFPFRHCSLSIEVQEETDDECLVEVKGAYKHPCLDYFIKRCEAPCVGKTNKAEYRKNIDSVIAFLKGDTKEAMNQLYTKMTDLAEQKKFERAARVRDKIKTIESLSEKQKITTPLIDASMDVIHYSLIGNRIFVTLMQIRGGKMLNQVQIEMKSTDSENAEPADILHAFIQKYYDKATDFPKTVLLPSSPANEQLLKNFLKVKSGHVITIHTPKIGEKMRLLELAYKNSLIFGEKQITRFETSESKEVQKAHSNIAEHLKLKSVPKRIECYDISHLGGTMQVASMVVFKGGIPDKAHYRLFKLKTLEEGTPDDFKGMAEVIDRRLRWLSKNKPPKGVRISVPTQKEKNEFEDDDKKLILLAKEKKKRRGQIIAVQHTADIVEIESLTSEDNDIKYALLQKVLDRLKAKRFYLVVSEEEKEFYTYFGFTEVRQLPSCIEETEGAPLAYNKLKRTTDASFTEKPNLIIIDGGKGQLSSAVKSMKEHNMDLPIISIAKKEELIFVPNQKHPLPIQEVSPEHYLVQQLRNEAHRFAVTYNRNLRSKKMVETALDGIKGIGEKNKRALLRAFGSVENIRNQPIAELKKIVGEKRALLIKTALNS